MNRDELLTKLAMEMSEWPVAETLKLRLTDNGNGTTRWGWVYPDDETGFSRKEYLQRRAQLINKPDWGAAPEWAEWLAQDAPGFWYWYESKPLSDCMRWDEFDGKHALASHGTTPAGHDWRQTLEPRPGFNESRADIIGQNGNDGDHYAGPLTHGELPAEEKHDCLRCGGEYWTPPHEYCPCLDATGLSDGSTASYYELPEGATELQHLISYRNLNAQDGEIFRSIYRKGRASHSDALRDAKKVLFYAKAEVDRLERYGK